MYYVIDNETHQVVKYGKNFPALEEYVSQSAGCQIFVSNQISHMMQNQAAKVERLYILTQLQIFIRQREKENGKAPEDTQL